MANIDDKKIPIGTTETPIVGRLHDVSEDHVVTGANEVFDDAFGERQSQINDKLRHYTKMAHIRIDAEEITREHNDNLLNEEINAKQLEIGAVETDIEPILDSPNMLPSGAVALNLGWYRGNENPEWVYCITDGAMRILAGIKKDGSVEWMVGVPTPVKNYVDAHIQELIERLEELEEHILEELDKKVDKEEGKSLINKDYADGVTYIKNPEFVEVKLDNEGKILEAIMPDGTKMLPAGYSIGGNVVKTISNPEYIAAWVDSGNHILFALRRNGDIVFGCGTPSKIKELVNELIKPFEELFHYEESPEFLKICVDNHGKIIYGVQKNGNFLFGIGVPTQIVDYIKSNVDNIVDTYGHYEYSPEFVRVTLDSDKNILFGIRKDGDIVFGYGVPKQIQSMIEETASALRRDMTMFGEYTDSPEWLKVITDKYDKMLFGINKHGELSLFSGISKETIETIGKALQIESIEDAEGRLQIVLDSQEKVVSYRKKDGTLHEENIEANNLSLSKQGADKFKAALNINRWYNKNIVWFGTSIPSYTTENGGYPNICADILGANIYNEAVGGSAARGYRPVGEDMDTSYWGRSYADHRITMGQTIAEKLGMLYTIITIDDVNQTVAWAGNTLGMHNLPGGWSSSNVPSYATAVAERKQLMQYSYEIKLISKYLDKDGSIIRTILNSDDVKEITGLSTPYSYLYDEQTMGFKCSPDLFVFDHAFNDTLNAEIPDAEIGSMNRETFQGAMNTFHYYITVLASAKPICVVSDYHADGHPWWAYSATKKIAAYWEVPFIDVKALLPFGWRSVTLSGYWDGAYNSYFGKYHNEGFSFTYNTLAGTDWSTNNMMMEYAYRNSTRPSAQTVINRWNIRTDTITGKQVYDAAAIYQYSKDGLHPFSQKYSLEKYAEVLSSALLTLSV